MFDIDSIPDSVIFKVIKKLEKEENRNYRIVSTKRYLNSIVSEIEKSENNIIWDDMYLYQSSGDNYIDRNIKKLSWFRSYVSDLLDICETDLIDSGIFDNDIVYFKYKDKYYKIETIYGQGSITSIEVCSEQSYYYDFDKHYTRLKK